MSSGAISLLPQCQGPAMYGDSRGLLEPFVFSLSTTFFLWWFLASQLLFCECVLKCSAGLTALVVIASVMTDPGTVSPVGGERWAAPAPATPLLVL